MDEISGEPTLSAQTTVVINVVNKAVPVFEKASYSAELSEDATVGTRLITVSAVSNVDGTIGYAIVDGDPDNHFHMQYISGNYYN